MHNNTTPATLATRPSLWTFTTTVNATIQPKECHIQKDSRFEYLLKIIIYIIAMVISLIGNSLLIHAVKKRKRMRTVTNFLIVNMAAADLFITVFNMPTYLKILITQKNDWMGGPLGELLCKLVLFIQGVSVTCSVLTLTVLSVHRFVSVFFPWKKSLSTRNVKYAITAIWISSLLFISPLLYALNIISFDGTLICDEKWSPWFDEKEAPKTYTVVLFVTLYMAPLLIMAVLYSCLIYKLWFRCASEFASSNDRRQSEEALSLSRVSSDEKGKLARSKKIVLKMLVTVVVVFALCWLPMHVRMFLYFFKKYPCGLPPFLDFIGYFFGHVNSALNPCIYVSFSESYRQTFRQVLLNNCGEKRVATPLNPRCRRDCLVELQKQRLNNKYQI